MWAPVLEVASRRSATSRRCARPTRRSSRSPRSPTASRSGRSTPAASPRWRSARGPGTEPAVLYLHGGGYIVGSAYGYRPLVGALVAAAGGRRAGAGLPARSRAPVPRRARGRPERVSLADSSSAAAPGIVLAGDSAGAGLVCSLLLTLKAQDLPLPAGAVLLCPAVDLDRRRRSSPPSAPIPRPSRRPAAATRPTSTATRSTTPSLSPLVRRPDRPAAAAVQTATGDSSLRDSRRWSSTRPRAASTRGSSSTRPTRTSSRCSGRSCPRRPTRSSRPAPSSASGWRARSLGAGQ